MPPSQTVVCNRLLALMSTDDFSLLSPHLSFLRLPRGFVLAEPEEPIRTIYFLDAGMASIVANSPEGLEIEAGVFGREGFGPSAPLMDADSVSTRIMIQVPGDGWAMSVEAFTAAVDESRSLRKLLTRYVQTLMLQTSQTALSNGVHQIDERLARWLLMVDDRMDGGEFPLTHEFMSIMLGVRRPSVTTALHVLEGNGFIRSERGSITITDRAAMEQFAADSYGKAENAYRCFLGSLRPPAGASDAVRPTVG